MKEFIRQNPQAWQDSTECVLLHSADKPKISLFVAARGQRGRRAKSEGKGRGVTEEKPFYRAEKGGGGKTDSGKDAEET